MRPAGEPRLNLWGFVGGIIIHDDMDIEPFGDLSIDLFEEVQELGRAARCYLNSNSRVTLSQDSGGLHFLDKHSCHGAHISQGCPRLRTWLRALLSTRPN